MLEPTARTEIEKWTRLAMRRWIAEMSSALRNNLSSQQYYLLEVLRAEGVRRSSELAEALQITLPAVTNLANKLVAGGFAERVPLESDRRVVQLRITDQGLEALQELDEKASLLVERFWKGLDTGEKTELTRLLRKAMEYKE
ncbi:MarR family winged helix-turn-helix transcriptional regulator [Paenibacillus mucilaginosus]|uniref:MarR family transcriptional regulator n=3 Tax=Paenibacillus mucilaginosus TaxID=61624 RepID=H6NRV9_9BACL|nr:MarR family transcriptional regulator [Paenibacillus mucilaginosus]AEI45126.1 transcriptional regulator, MarR family [Paenibacillus mucilaginosus KNP414]AFC32845.1 MarR family transcriptional regulator [Paenibacillus mucilaginosus 3016]AFH65180.1 MarR family transcriptional regulator [Paenibacillus mucilaginosus K02]MCG7212981.1 MarR family transcriptional regulator [Paenibacillus mucilaginosus]WDM26607.1 MarR family transcriptional regulator [Paenibacillus mucilaginosus]